MSHHYDVINMALNGDIQKLNLTHNFLCIASIHFSFKIRHLGMESEVTFGFEYSESYGRSGNFHEVWNHYLTHNFWRLNEKHQSQCPDNFLRWDWRHLWYFVFVYQLISHESSPDQLVFHTFHKNKSKYIMGSSKNKNKGRKTSLGGHLKSKSLGKWFMHWHIRNFFRQNSNCIL